MCDMIVGILLTTWGLCVRRFASEGRVAGRHCWLGGRVLVAVGRSAWFEILSPGDVDFIPTSAAHQPQVMP